MKCCSKRFSVCFPRIRGDIPVNVPHQEQVAQFSPRARGCSRNAAFMLAQGSVFPACAGMFPAGHPRSRSCGGFPRVRGDVPSSDKSSGLSGVFSPRARGCSSWPQPSPPFGSVFPACAGMFPRVASLEKLKDRFPRIRGDVPVIVARVFVGLEFSPHTRGCSAFVISSLPVAKVFPAYAGMSPAPGNHSNPGGCFPRMHAGMFRGPSADTSALACFPAYVGMFHGWCLRCARQRGFPCIRGDVPIIDVIKTAFGWFPRIRGDVPGHSIAVYFNEESSPRA